MKKCAKNTYLLSGNDITYPPDINYNGVRANRRSMGWSKLIVGSHALQNFVKAYVNVVNAIDLFQPEMSCSLSFSGM